MIFLPQMDKVGFGGGHPQSWTIDFKAYHQVSSMCGLLVKPKNTRLEYKYGRNLWKMSKIGQNSMKKWPFFAIILPWMARYGSIRSFLLIFSARDDLVKVSWKSDAEKCRNQQTPPYFDQLSERYQPPLSWKETEMKLEFMSCIFRATKRLENAVPQGSSFPPLLPTAAGTNVPQCDPDVIWACSHLAQSLHFFFDIFQNWHNIGTLPQ